MTKHLVFYVSEAACLACIGWFGLALASNGLRRLRVPVHLYHLRTIVVLWLVLAVVGIGFGEVIGPEFILPYHFCMWLAIGGALVWLLSFFIHRGGLIDKRPEAS